VTDRMTEQEIEALCEALETDQMEGWSSDGICVSGELATRALTAIRQLQQPWRGMESAPRDGTAIDIWVGGEFPRRMTDVSWREPNGSEWWVHGGDTIETPDATWHDCFGPFGKEDQPTHWQPLPTPPETER